MNKEIITEQLKEHVVKVNFTKVDGTNRIMKCTLKPDILPQNLNAELSKRKISEDQICVWDIEKDGWRSFNVSSVNNYSLVHK